jgi:hypothetical protein
MIGTRDAAKLADWLDQAEHAIAVGIVRRERRPTANWF